jgi:hypothetical protein
MINAKDIEVHVNLTPWGSSISYIKLLAATGQLCRDELAHADQLLR